MEQNRKKHHFLEFYSPRAISQNHRIVEVVKDLLRLSCPTPMLKQSHLDPAVQDYVQTAYTVLKVCW